MNHFESLLVNCYLSLDNPFNDMSIEDRKAITEHYIALLIILNKHEKVVPIDVSLILDSYIKNVEWDIEVIILQKMFPDEHFDLDQ